MKENNNVTYVAKVHSHQMTILVIQIFLMVIGGCVFGFGVVTRPILRITKPEFHHHVEWITDMMVASGLAQLATAGFDCFAACWKLIWPIYLGIGVTAMTMCLEVAAIGFSLLLLHQADFMANENVLHAWYWVECRKTSSCHDAMLSYIYSYVLPQIVLAAFAIFLQGLGIMYLTRLVQAIAEHARKVTSYGEWYREHMERPDDVKFLKTVSKKEKIEVESNKEDDEEDAASDNRLKEPNQDYHTPSSILKVDHGYVQASGASLDFDDHYMRNRSVKLKNGKDQQISFNTNVQVHYYDTKENVGKGGISKQSFKSSLKSDSKVRLMVTDDNEMEDLTPETIQLQCGQLLRRNSNSQQLDLAKVATNLSKILAESPSVPSSASRKSPYRHVENIVMDQMPPAPPSTPNDAKATFSFVSPSKPTINIYRPEEDGGVPPVVSPPMSPTGIVQPFKKFGPRSFD